MERARESVGFGLASSEITSERPKTQTTLIYFLGLRTLVSFDTLLLTYTFTIYVHVRNRRLEPGTRSPNERHQQWFHRDTHLLSC